MYVVLISPTNWWNIAHKFFFNHFLRRQSFKKLKPKNSISLSWNLGPFCPKTGCHWWQRNRKWSATIGARCASLAFLSCCTKEPSCHALGNHRWGWKALYTVSFSLGPSSLVVNRVKKINEQSELSGYWRGEGGANFFRPIPTKELGPRLS